MRLKKYINTIVITVLLCLISSFIVSAEGTIEKEGIPASTLDDVSSYKYGDIPFEVVNDNVPDFYLWQITTDPYVKFSPFDELGRTGPGMACLSKETLPTEKRGTIGNIKPSGWHTVRYDDLIEDKYLYNRSHVIGYQLCGDNDTPENLFTGTRYLNADTMVFFENKVRQYLDQSEENHVIYRVTPMYNGNDLVASGVQMEAFSVEDLGRSLCFNVYIYNVQPGIDIDYATGGSERIADYKPGNEIGVAETFANQSISESFAMGSSTEKETDETDLSGDEQDQGKTKDTEKNGGTSGDKADKGTATESIAYILNINTKKFHYPSCQSVSDMKEQNKKEYSGSRDDLIKDGYEPCGRCNP